MRILLASPRGFCAGVNRAIETLREALRKFGRPMYVYHEIVHNRWVVEEFQAKGAVFVDTLEEVPVGSCLMYSAHGVSPEVREKAAEMGLRTIDATCPLVARIHAQARQFAEEGLEILLLGHRGHDEIVGIMGEVPERIQILSSVEDARKISVPNPEKVACLTQTTFSIEEMRRILAVLQERFPKLRQPPQGSICYATSNRQQAVRELASQAERVLVVGSPNSSNSRRLQELARQQGVEAYLLDGAEELREEWLDGVETVLITAGASAPETVVRSILAFLREKYHAEVETVEVCRESLQFPIPDLSEKKCS
ncbi:MAG: 4-hydroxy-3-methylbut-2-enyl diphosphate reductase [Planctomycetia bacterium]|nr:4-hydroxy-3-methylbut-2-enyl diphosphate reductase [Planctomycetia bacterium]